jgi:hypothetical protein
MLGGFMAIEETVQSMRQHLRALSKDLEKAVSGNQAAAQRVRTTSVHFAKISKLYRKESVKELNTKRKK